jgi:hypothetical protein
MKEEQNNMQKCNHCHQVTPSIYWKKSCGCGRLLCLVCILKEMLNVSCAENIL